MKCSDITGRNTKEFVDFSNKLIKDSNFIPLIRKFILECYENEVDIIKFKEYMITDLQFEFLYQLMETDSCYMQMIKRRDAGEFTLSDSEVLASAAHEVYKKLEYK